MTVCNVWNFRNNINQGKNGPEYLLKKEDLRRKISKEYTLGITNLLRKAHHLIYGYFKKTLFEMKFGQQRDWIKQIQLARKEFLSGAQPTPKRKSRTNSSLRAWLITSTETIEEQSDDEESW